MDGSAIAAAARIAARSFQSFSQATGTVLEHLEARFADAGLVVSQFDYGEDEYRVLESRGNPSLALEAGVTMPLESSLCFHMAADRAPRLSHDAARDAVYGTLDMRESRAIGSYLGVPLELSDGTRVGSLCALAPKPARFGEDDLYLLVVLGRLLGHEWERVRRERELRRLRETLREQDVSDPLTGLPNRERFLASMDREWRLTQRAAISSYLVVISLDDVVNVAERHGPALANVLVRDVGRALEAVSRNTDIVGRAGEHDLAAVLVHCHGEEGAAAFCDRVRSSIARMTSERAASVEVSFGVQALADAPTHMQALETAQRLARGAAAATPA